jgi:hypothetical protein
MPLGIFGIAMMYRWSRRLALLMTLWLVPGVLIYNSYYWGQDLRGLAYLRFFVTLLPPIILGAAWLLQHARVELDRGSSAGPIAAGILVAIASAVCVYDNVGALERDFAIERNLADIGDHVRAHIKSEIDPSRRAIVFGDQRQLLNYLQFAGDYECYAFDVFSQKFGQRMGSGADPDAPNPLQRARQDYLREVVYKGKTDADLVNEGRRIMSAAITSNRQVFVVLPSSFMPMFNGRMMNKEFETKVIDKWREPVEMTAEGKKALANLGFGAAFVMGRGVPMDWQIVEIKRKG